MNIPCENCITLSVCIQKFKKIYGLNKTFPVARMCCNCKLLYNAYNIDDEGMCDLLEDWWKDNYGK